MAAKTIKDRASTTDMIADWIYNNCPSWTVDTLLTRPIDAMRMSLEVAANSGRLTPGAARLIAKHVKELAKLEAEMDVLDEVCRTALASRKRGEFRRGKR